MKKLVLIFVMAIGIISTSFSQNLTLSQLLSLKNKDLAEIEEYITKKGWEFNEAKSPTDTTAGLVTFTYNKSYMSELAESFLSYQYSSISDKKGIRIQIGKKSKYIEYLNGVKGYGCKLVKSEINGNNIEKVYQGATTTFWFTISTTTNYFDKKVVVWNLIILNNDDYNLEFK